MSLRVDERIRSMRRMLDDMHADHLQDDDCWPGLQIQLSAIERTVRHSLAAEMVKRKLEGAIEAFTSRRPASEGKDSALRYARAMEALEGHEQALVRSFELLR